MSPVQPRAHHGPSAGWPVITRETLPWTTGDAFGATTEIARFDAELGSEIVPFSAILLRGESVASSNIEQLTASARSVALAELETRPRSTPR